MNCTVCNHPQRHDIDRDLLAGGVTFEALKKKFGPSMSALWRHKKHLLEKMAQAEKRFLDNLRLGVLLKLNSRLERNERTAQAAEADGNSRLVLQADRDATRILTYIDKMDIQLDQDTVYRLLASPEWAQQGSLLPTDPEFIAAANQFLADKLFIPCPEPHPDLDDLDDEEEEEEYPPVGERCDSGPEIIRAKSAKLPKNPPPSEQINEQYQIDIPCEKIAAQTSCAAGKHPQGGGAQAPPAARISTAAATGKLKTVIKSETPCPGLMPLQNSTDPVPLKTSPPQIEICCFPLFPEPNNQRKKARNYRKIPTHRSKLSNNINIICHAKIVPRKTPGPRPRLCQRTHKSRLNPQLSKLETQNSKLCPRLRPPALPRNCSSKSSSDWTSHKLPNLKPKTGD